MMVPNNHGFPTRNDHFGVFWGYHHLRKPPNDSLGHDYFLFLWTISFLVYLGRTWAVYDHKVPDCDGHNLARDIRFSCRQ